MKITSNGRKTEIDFQGATLPDGRLIEGVLSENEKLKKDINSFKKEVKDKSSILTILIRNRLLRIIIELILIIGTILGIILLI